MPRGRAVREGRRATSQGLYYTAPIHGWKSAGAARRGLGPPAPPLPSAHPRPVRLLPAYRVIPQVHSFTRRSFPADASAVPGVSSSLHPLPELDEKHSPVPESCDGVEALDDSSVVAGCEIEKVVAG
uniref:Uncharacterized protein n=1 Tax=Oryza barthii TaxID=65489 RepID=A0A0D3G3T3_9ORYZ